MKKIYSTIVALVMVLTLCIGIGATEVTDTDFEAAEIVTEEIAEEADEEVVESTTAESTESEYHTLFTRLWEYCMTYKTEIVGVVGDIAIFVLALFIKLRNDKRTANIAQGIISIKGDTTDTTKAQTSVVGVVNEMVDGYNALKQSYDKYGETEDDRNRVVGTLVAQNAAMLEILTTITVNNKNLPQGIKDIVMLKYANCLKALDDDEKLKAVVTSVRESIGTNLTIEPVEEKDNKTEE